MKHILMSNLDIKNYQFPIKQYREICVVYSNFDRYAGITAVLLTYLTEEEEQELEEKQVITITRKNKEYTIYNRSIYCFGDVDFSNNSDDYCDIAELNILSNLTFSGIRIPANYDYGNNSVTSNTNYVKWYDTVYIEDIIQYCHGLLGKPKKVLLFKYVYKLRNNKVIENKLNDKKKYKSPRRENGTNKLHNFSTRIEARINKISRLTIKIK